MTSDDSTLFGSKPEQVSLLASHPPPVHIFRLWQIYLDNVHPLTMIFHAPTTQERIVEACENLAGISKKTEAIMFGIYALAMSSLTHEEAEKTFGVEKLGAVTKYQVAAQQALRNADFLRSSDLGVLTAFLLYLVSFVWFMLAPACHDCCCYLHG